MRRTYKIIGVGVAALAMVAVGTAAGAVLTGRSGTFSERQTFIRETDPWTTALPVWMNVPGAAAVVTVPRGTSRLIDARFTAESSCTGSGGWCSVRIVAVNAGGGVTELEPASGTDFAFDTSSTTDGWEGHAIERSSFFRLPGRHRVIVQARTNGPLLRLDDWHLAVETVRP